MVYNNNLNGGNVHVTPLISLYYHTLECTLIEVQQVSPFRETEAQQMLSLQSEKLFLIIAVFLVCLCILS